MHTMCCTNINLAMIREDLMGRFIDVMSKLVCDQDTMQVLLQRMLDEPSSSQPHLVHLSSCFNQHSLRTLWHGIFPAEFVELINKDFLTAHRIVVKIIVISLNFLHLL